MTLDETNINQAANLLLQAKHVIVFTGAGISVSSGIPSFRGENGIWNRYNPQVLELSNYYRNPEPCWKVIKEIFFDSMQDVKANPSHFAITELQKMGLVQNIFTQNIDNLHQAAGSDHVYEFHGNTRSFVCRKCKHKYDISEVDFDAKYPLCLNCSGLLKPDFIFFSESLPSGVLEKAYQEAELADLVIIVGCSGEVFPANQIPLIAKQCGAKIVDINPQSTLFSDQICDVKITAKSELALPKLVETVKKLKGETV